MALCQMTGTRANSSLYHYIRIWIKVGFAHFVFLSHVFILLQWKTFFRLWRENLVFKFTLKLPVLLAQHIATAGYNQAEEIFVKWLAQGHSDVTIISL